MRRTGPVRPHRFAFLWVLALTGGCAAGGDSAGEPARWRLAAEAHIGADSGALAPAEVADLAVGPDGAVHVLQPGDHRVRVFSPEGRPLRTLGGRGRDPGQFLRPQGLGWRGDTLIVAEPGPARLNAFSPAGAHLATLTLGGDDRFAPRAVLADGSVLGDHAFLLDRVVSGALSSDSLVRAARTGPRLGPVASLPLQNRYGLARLPQAYDHPLEVFFPQPFGDAALFDVDPQGRGVVVVERPVPDPGSPTAPVRVVRYGPAGERIWAATVTDRPRPLDAGTVEDSVLALAARLRAIPGLENLVADSIAPAVRAALYAPAHHPPVQAVVAGRDGTTWLRLAPRGGGATWLVLGPAGAALAAVQAPAGLVIHATDRDRVWGVVPGPGGWPVVVRYRVG